MSSGSTRMVRLPLFQSSASSPVSPGCSFAALARELGVRVALACTSPGARLLDEPVEDVADGRLARFEAVHAGHDRLGHDAAQAGHVGQLCVQRRDHAVARAGADDLHQRARPAARADGAHVGVERADRHGDARRQADLLRDLGVKLPGHADRPAPLWSSSGTATGPARANRETRRWQPAPSSLYIALCPAAQMPRAICAGSVLPVMYAGTKSASSTHDVRGLGHVRRRRACSAESSTSTTRRNTCRRTSRGTVRSCAAFAVISSASAWPCGPSTATPARRDRS